MLGVGGCERVRGLVIVDYGKNVYALAGGTASRRWTGDCEDVGRCVVLSDDHRGFLIDFAHVCGNLNFRVEVL